MLGGGLRSWSAFLVSFRVAVFHFTHSFAAYPIQLEQSVVYVSKRNREK